MHADNPSVFLMAYMVHTMPDVKVNVVEFGKSLGPLIMGTMKLHIHKPNDHHEQMPIFGLLA